MPNVFARAICATRFNAADAIRIQAAEARVRSQRIAENPRTIVVILDSVFGSQAQTVWK